MQAFPYIRLGESGEVWFAAKPIATWLGYKDTDQSIRNNVTERHKAQLNSLITDEAYGKIHPQSIFITQAGLLMLLMKSQRSVLEETAEAKAGTASVDEIAQELQDCRLYSKQRCGYIYAVTSPLLNAVKLGRWGGSIQRLKYRYTGIYGDSISLYTSATPDSYAAEAQLHQRFAAYRLSNELFSKAMMASYVAYIQGRQDSVPHTAPAEDMTERASKRIELQDVTHLLGNRAEAAVDTAPDLQSVPPLYEQHLGVTGNPNTLRLLGKRVAEEYRRRHRETPPRKQAVVDGCLRNHVKAYSLVSDPWITQYIDADAPASK